MSGAGLYGGWRRLDFIIQTGANRKRISPKRGAGMYNIFKPLPLAWQTCTTYTANLHRSHNKPAPTILQTCAARTGFPGFWSSLSAGVRDGTASDTDRAFWCPRELFYAVRTPIGHSGVHALEMVRFLRGVCTAGTLSGADFVYIHRGDVPLVPVCRGVCTPGTLSGADFVYIYLRHNPDIG